ncbi:hypothetical protein ACJX0J_031719, partial [Zea mays]
MTPSKLSHHGTIQIRIPLYIQASPLFPYIKKAIAHLRKPIYSIKHGQHPDELFLRKHKTKKTSNIKCWMIYNLWALHESWMNSLAKSITIKLNKLQTDFTGI